MAPWGVPVAPCGGSWGAPGGAFWFNVGSFLGPKGNSERKKRFSKKHENQLVFKAKMKVAGFQITTFWLLEVTFSTSGKVIENGVVRGHAVARVLGVGGLARPEGGYLQATRSAPAE